MVKNSNFENFFKYTRRSSDEVEIIRGRISSFLIYEVTPEELKQLSKGSSGRIYLDFALCLLSIGITLLTGVLTGTINSNVSFTVLVIACTGTITAGVLLLLFWCFTRRSVRKLLNEIERRNPSYTGYSKKQTKLEV